jgi:DNA-binding XRE family transcriptional regulator
MDNREFSTLRKKLMKTQKELAKLLGTSLKAVCSYEQGWRSVPTHVERQLYFLVARKLDIADTQKNCWEIIECPENRKVQCPAWEFNSGKFCWFINGTICTCISQKTWDEKIQICKKCEVFKDIL